MDLHPAQPEPQLAIEEAIPTPIVEPQPASTMGLILVAVAESFSPPRRDALLDEADARVPKVPLSAALEPLITKSPPAASGPEPKPVGDSSPAHRIELQLQMSSAARELGPLQPCLPAPC